MTVRQRWAANFLSYELFLGLIPVLGLVVWGETSATTRLDVYIAAHGAALYTLTAPILAAMLGFIIAAASIIVTAAPQERLEQLRQSNHYRDLWGTFRSAMLFLGAGTLMTILGVVVTTTGVESRGIFYVATGLTVLAALRVARSIWAVNWVIRIFTSPSQARPAGG
jgi:uncharacterized membrane protein